MCEKDRKVLPHFVCLQVVNKVGNLVHELKEEKEVVFRLIVLIIFILSLFLIWRRLFFCWKYTLDLFYVDTVCLRATFPFHQLFRVTSLTVFYLSIQMNKCLLDNQKLWQQKHDELEKKSKQLAAAKNLVRLFSLFIILRFLTFRESIPQILSFM